MIETTSVRSSENVPIQIVLAVAGAILLIAIPYAHNPALVVAAVALVAITALLLMSLRGTSSKETTRTRVRVRAIQEGLDVDGAVVRRSQVLSAAIVAGERPDRPIVVVERLFGWPLRLEVRSTDAAHRIIRALASADSADVPSPRPAIEQEPEAELAPDPAPVRRRDRSTAAWIASLRALGEGIEAGPRTAPIPRDRLLRIIEAPALSAVDRAAAAVALAGNADEGERERLRTVAEDAAPRLRVVLERAAGEADEETMAAALEAVEAAER